MSLRELEMIKASSLWMVNDEIVTLPPGNLNDRGDVLEFMTKKQVAIFSYPEI